MDFYQSFSLLFTSTFDFKMRRRRKCIYQNSSNTAIASHIFSFLYFVVLMLCLKHKVRSTAESELQLNQIRKEHLCFPEVPRINPYSLQGKWIRISQTLPRKKQYCDISKSSSRSCMSGVQKRFSTPKYFTTELCVLPDFNENVFHRALGDRELHFLGDSVSMQQKVRLRCDLKNSSKVNGIRVSHTKHLMASLGRLARIPHGSVVLVNIGLHFNNRISYRNFLENFEELCLKNRCTNATIVWQETAAQHFPGSKNGYFVERGKCKSGCVPLQAENMRKLDFRNKMANLVMQQYGIPVLHVWDLTQDAYDMHVQLNINSGLCDCTHFCNVEMGVFRAYNRVLQAWLVKSFS